jgi:hypothetical protein
MNTTLATSIALGASIVWAGVAILKFPSSAEMDILRDMLWKRYLGKDYPTYAVGDRHDADRLMGYAERVIDRQINKARGILPFNSIVIAAFSYERAQLLQKTPTIFNNVDVRFMLIFAMGLLAVSSFLCLLLMLVRFGAVADYGSFTAEIAKTVHVVRKRAIVLEIAVVLSFVALAIGALMIGTVELV